MRRRGEDERGTPGVETRLSTPSITPRTRLSSCPLYTAPILLEDGRDLVTLVCQRYVSPPEGEPAAVPPASPPPESEDEDGEGGPASPRHHDFDGFLVALLRVGATPVTAAVVR